MGLDIGAVNIDYLDRPSGAAYRFAWHRALSRLWLPTQPMLH